VPLASLLGASNAPGELADRSAFVPGEILREQLAKALSSNSSEEVLFTRLLTDNGGRLLDTTELGRYPSARLAQAIRIRAGTCQFPTCTVPADRCDLDHHEPVPRARPPDRTSIRSADGITGAKRSPGMPPSEIRTASTGPYRPPNATDASTNHYQQDARSTVDYVVATLGVLREAQVQATVARIQPA
jgi:hypothetical protein